MVVVLALVELEHRLAALEVVARQDAGLLELHQHAVDRRQADVGVVGEQDAEDVLGAHVALGRVLEHLEHLDARQRRLEAAVLQFFGVGHGRRGARGAPGAPVESSHHTSLAAPSTSAARRP